MMNKRTGTKTKSEKHNRRKDVARKKQNRADEGTRENLVGKRNGETQDLPAEDRQADRQTDRQTAETP